MRRNILVVASLLLLACSSWGQIGIVFQSGYQQFGGQNADFAVPENAYSFAFGPSYGFRFRSKRIEMDPAILATGIFGTYPELNRRFREFGAELQFPIAIYPMDFGNDCNCPTFNKQGEKFRKGFFFFVVPALRYSQIRLEKNVQVEDVSESSFRYSIGIGIGMDYGINRHTTLTPSLSMNKSFEDRFSYLKTEQVLEISDYGRTTLQLGIRLKWYHRGR